MLTPILRRHVREEGRERNSLAISVAPESRSHAQIGGFVAVNLVVPFSSEIGAFPRLGLHVKFFSLPCSSGGFLDGLGNRG